MAWQAFVATRAADAATVFVYSHLQYQREVALAARNSIARAAAAQRPSPTCGRVLQRARQLHRRSAMNLQPFEVFSNSTGSPATHTNWPIRRTERTWLNAGDRTRERSDRRRTTFNRADDA